MIISVLVAAYEADQWIAESLDSILRQRLPFDWQLEVLVGVDDHDLTYDVAMRKLSDHPAAQSGAEPRVDFALYHCRPNKGPYVVRNLLLSECRGDCIAIFDADDVMDEGRLSAMLSAILSGADYVQTGCVVTDSQLGAPRPRGPESIAGVAMYTRDVYERLGGYQPWRVAADTEFKTRVNYAGFLMRNVDAPLFFYRQHPGQLTQREGTSLTSKLRHDLATKINEDTEAYKAGAEVLKVDAELAVASGCFSNRQ